MHECCCNVYLYLHLSFFRNEKKGRLTDKGEISKFPRHAIFHEFVENLSEYFGETWVTGKNRILSKFKFRGECERLRFFFLYTPGGVKSFGPVIRDSTRPISADKMVTELEKCDVIASVEA